MKSAIKAHDKYSINNVIKDRVRKSESSFYWAMRLMSPEKRKAMYAVYAFCREVDDIADGNNPETQKRLELNEWRDEIESIYQSKPKTVIGHSLLEFVDYYELRKQDFLDVIDGMEMDIPQEFSISNMSELEMYCDKVACSVGRLSCNIFELENQLGFDLANSLGQALQLTNILRDVHEDFLRGKVYLPLTLLQENGMPPKQTDWKINHPAVKKTCKLISDTAGKRFAESKNILLKCDQKKVRPALIMMTIYERIFAKVCERNWCVLEKKINLSKWEKLALIIKSTCFPQITLKSGFIGLKCKRLQP